MKRLIRASQEPVFAMSRLSAKKADKSLTGEFGDYIYFSSSNSSHGPRIKFYGGTKETGYTEESPSIRFDTDGNCEVVVENWMNKRNCPNAYNNKYTDTVVSFIQRFLPLLLLVWFRRLPEDELLLYFQGHESFMSLLDTIKEYNDNLHDTLYDELDKCMFNLQLHQICKKYDMYKF